MKTHVILAAAAVALLAFDSGSMVSADTFGTGVNQFTIDFVPISGATNPTPIHGYGIVNHDYRMGTYEITNDQWNKFTAIAGVPTGSLGWYSYSSNFTGADQPTDSVSWYEAAQFVNWLNVSTGHQAAYKFTGTQGTSNQLHVSRLERRRSRLRCEQSIPKSKCLLLPTERE